MKRINVIGTTGSGKSTVSRALAERLGYPYIQMDALFWKPNWIESSDDEFLPKVADAVSRDVWVLDGNYSRTADIKLEKVDTVIWLDYSYARTLFQLLRRTICRAVSRQALWENTANRESFRRSFLSKKSILVWFFKNFKRNRLRYLDLINSPQYAHINFIHLRNSNDLKKLLAKSQNHTHGHTRN